MRTLALSGDDGVHWTFKYRQVAGSYPSVEWTSASLAEFDYELEVAAWLRDFPGLVDSWVSRSCSSIIHVASSSSWIPADMMRQE